MFVPLLGSQTLCFPLREPGVAIAIEDTDRNPNFGRVHEIESSS